MLVEQLFALYLSIFMSFSYRYGENTELIPYETQKQYIEEYVIEIIDKHEYDVHPALILAMVEKESTYKWQATNGVHIGLMQINPKYQKARMERLGVEDLAANPYDNLLVGIDFMDELLEKYDNPYDALNVYNAGSTDGYAHAYSISVMDRKYEIEHELWDKYDAL